tara:strand:+ start:2621 stop:3013 length:393 start_codon:yes stop_codon:yes gene_type:complete
VTIKAKDLTPTVTTEVILHHNYPMQIIRYKDSLRWEIARNRGGAKYKFVTHFTGLLMSNDVDTKVFNIYGGPYAGSGLGYDFLSRGDNETALAIIPWNYVMKMWVITQKEIPEISAKYGRLNIVKTKVTF